MSDEKAAECVEHDFPTGPNPITCRSCGVMRYDYADPSEEASGSGPDYDGMGKGNWEDEDGDEGAVSSGLVFKGLATFVIGGLLYLTYWTAAHMLIKEFLLLSGFDIFTFLSWARAYGRTQIRVYDFRPPVQDDDPGEI